MIAYKCLDFGELGLSFCQDNGVGILEQKKHTAGGHRQTPLLRTLVVEQVCTQI